jgi:lauroyl/myristoyl acyltransferase
MERAIPLLPRRLCAALAEAVGSLAFWLDRHGRAVALANLEAVFGATHPEAERRRIARRSYQVFARNMFDLFWSRRLTPENYTRYIELAGDVDPQFLNQTPKDAKTTGGIVIGSHSGNFEWGSIGFGFKGVRGMLVTETFKNPLLAPIFERMRGVSGNVAIPQEISMLRMLRALHRKEIAGLLIDLNLRPDQPAVVIDAFGRKMCVTHLHASLAQRTGAAFLPLETEPLPGGRVRAILHPPLAVPPGATVQEITQQCWNFFEARIRERPELWMWAYKHWRYRPQDAAPESYPFYANTNRKFEALLAQSTAPQA